MISPSSTKGGRPRSAAVAVCALLVVAVCIALFARPRAGNTQPLLQPHPDLARQPVQPFTVQGLKEAATAGSRPANDVRLLLRELDAAPQQAPLPLPQSPRPSGAPCTNPAPLLVPVPPMGPEPAVMVADLTLEGISAQSFLGGGQQQLINALAAILHTPASNVHVTAASQCSASASASAPATPALPHANVVAASSVESAASGGEAGPQTACPQPTICAIEQYFCGGLILSRYAYNAVTAGGCTHDAEQGLWVCGDLVLEDETYGDLQATSCEASCSMQPDEALAGCPSPQPAPTASPVVSPASAPVTSSPAALAPSPAPALGSPELAPGPMPQEALRCASSSAASACTAEEYACPMGVHLSVLAYQALQNGACRWFGIQNIWVCGDTVLTTAMYDAVHLGSCTFTCQLAAQLGCPVSLPDPPPTSMPPNAVMASGPSSTSGPAASDPALPPTASLSRTATPAPSTDPQPPLSQCPRPETGCQTEQVVCGGGIRMSLSEYEQLLSGGCKLDAEQQLWTCGSLVMEAESYAELIAGTCVYQCAQRPSLPCSAPMPACDSAPCAEGVPADEYICSIGPLTTPRPQLHVPAAAYTLVQQGLCTPSSPAKEEYNCGGFWLTAENYADVKQGPCVKHLPCKRVPTLPCPPQPQPSSPIPAPSLPLPMPGSPLAGPAFAPALAPAAVTAPALPSPYAPAPANPQPVPYTPMPTKPPRGPQHTTEPTATPSVATPPLPMGQSPLSAPSMAPHVSAPSPAMTPGPTPIPTDLGSISVSAPPRRRHAPAPAPMPTMLPPTAAPSLAPAPSSAALAPTAQPTPLAYALAPELVPAPVPQPAAYSPSAYAPWSAAPGPSMMYSPSQAPVTAPPPAVYSPSAAMPTPSAAAPSLAHAPVPAPQPATYSPVTSSPQSYLPAPQPAAYSPVLAPALAPGTAPYTALAPDAVSARAPVPAAQPAAAPAFAPAPAYQPKSQSPASGPANGAPGYAPVAPTPAPTRKAPTPAYAPSAGPSPAIYSPQQQAPAVAPMPAPMPAPTYAPALPVYSPRSGASPAPYSPASPATPSLTPAPAPYAMPPGASPAPAPYGGFYAAPPTPLFGLSPQPVPPLFGRPPLPPMPVPVPAPGPAVLAGAPAGSLPLVPAPQPCPQSDCKLDEYLCGSGLRVPSAVYNAVISGNCTHKVNQGNWVCSNVVMEEDFYAMLLKGPCEHICNGMTPQCAKAPAPVPATLPALPPAVAGSPMNGPARRSILEPTLGSTCSSAQGCLTVTILVGARNASQGAALSKALALASEAGMLGSQLASSGLTGLCGAHTQHTGVIDSEAAMLRTGLPASNHRRLLESSEQLALPTSDAYTTSHASSSVQEAGAQLGHHVARRDGMVWMGSDWSPCSSPCGGGLQTRHVGCYRPANQSRVEDVFCHGSSPTERRACNVNPCPASWLITPGAPCTKGAASTAAAASCIDSQGRVLPSEACGNALLQRLSLPCAPGSAEEPIKVDALAAQQAQQAGAYTWFLGSWSACNAACGGGQALRTVHCVAPNGDVVGDALCASAKPAGVQRCGMQPCNLCTYSSCGGHGSCSDNVCHCEKGWSGLECNIPPECQSGVVDGNGGCCVAGVVSATSECCTSAAAVLDLQGHCCDSGLLDACGVCNGSAKFVDVQGSCCATVLDAAGVCCASGRLDGCGVCDGGSASCATAAILDLQVVNLAPVEASHARMASSLASLLSAALGTPIAVTDLQLPAVLDTIEADAVGNGPMWHEPMHMNLRRLRGQSLLSLLKGASRLLRLPSLAPALDEATAPPTITVGFTAQPLLGLHLATLASAMQEINGTLLRLDGSAQISMTRLVQASQQGVCGDGICQAGERDVATSMTACPQDCLHAFASCPSPASTAMQTPSKPCSNHGRCFTNMGICDCFEGYTGAACEACTDGYKLHAEKGICIRDISLMLASPLKDQSTSDATIPSASVAQLKGRTNNHASAGTTVKATPGKLYDRVAAVADAIWSTSSLSRK